MVPTLLYDDVNDDEWEIIDYIEGITEEFEDYDRSIYQIAELPITEAETDDLINFDDDVLNFWNNFDIELKKQGSNMISI